MLREVQRRGGLPARLAACLDDPRDPARTQHTLADIIAFRTLMIAAGYEDANDAGALRRDPVFKLALERLPGGADLCSQPTLSRLENGPHQRHPKAPRGHGQQQDVHVALTEFPVGAVETQDPGRARADQGHDQGNHPVVVEPRMLEEPLRPAIGRCNLNAIGPFGGDVRQVDRARADDAGNQKAERFQARLAKADMGRERPRQDGEKAGLQGMLPWAVFPPGRESISPSTVSPKCALSCSVLGRSKSAIALCYRSQNPDPPESR